MDHEIKNAGVLNSLRAKLRNAQALINRHQVAAAVNLLEAFINEVEAQKGKQIDAEAAGLLIEDAEWVIAQF